MMTDMLEQLQNIEQEATQAIENMSAAEWEKKFLGKHSQLNALNKHLKDIPAEQRSNTGAQIQALKQKLKKLLEEKQLATPLTYIQYDFTTKPKNQFGKQHPMSFLHKEISNIFIQEGFTEHTGPEIETSYYNFDSLNTPPCHPSRSMRDTFYLKNHKDDQGQPALLRTHTTSMQARMLETGELPLKSIVYGNVYRRDDDPTHTPMFTQLEGLIVDHDLTVHHLKSWIMSFLHKLLPNIIDIRFRPSFFPFTYLSAEVDIKLKNQNKWLELLGCGMVHPQILQNFNIDPQEYQGLAFGMGIERLAMLRFNIQDIRHLYQNDTFFLESIAL